MMRAFASAVATLALCSACRDHEPSTKDKELDVQLAQAKERQAEAETEKAVIEAHTGQQTAPGSASASPSQQFRRSKQDVAQMAVKKYAFEAFGEWSYAHPDKACPDKLDDLTQYMATEDANDPWGRPYIMFCGQNLPAGAKGGLAVMSTGSDGQQNTADDIKSW
jgi:type II secretion system (T2SS) protein G